MIKHFTVSGEFCMAFRCLLDGIEVEHKPYSAEEVAFVPPGEAKIKIVAVLSS
jgi:hypothetical protein